MATGAESALDVVMAQQGEKRLRGKIGVTVYVRDAYFIRQTKGFNFSVKKSHFFNGHNEMVSR